MSTAQPLPGQLELPLTPELTAEDRVWLESRVQPAWRADAACRDTDPRLFDPIDDDTGADESIRVAAAKGICGHCPVREPCLIVALLNDEYGIWGGHDDTSREHIRHTITDPDNRETALGPDVPKPVTVGEDAA